MINVIIPAYNAHDTIEKTIASLAAQSISDKIEIILVDDCSERDYLYLKEKFQNLIKIRVIRHEKNLGVGFARQTGLDSVRYPYFTFSDADDFFIAMLYFERALKFMDSDKDIVSLCSRFYREEKNGNVIEQENHSWSFARFYKTDFVKKYNIKFPPQNANEDTIFNKTVELVALEKNKKIINWKNTPYIWKYKESSITRINNNQYAFYDSPISLLRGVSFISSNPNIHKEEYHQLLLGYLFLFFNSYYLSLYNRPNEYWHKEILQEIKIFYKNQIKKRNIKLNNNLIKKELKNIIDPSFPSNFYNLENFKEFIKIIEN